MANKPINITYQGRDLGMATSAMRAEAVVIGCPGGHAHMQLGPTAAAGHQPTTLMPICSMVMVEKTPTKQGDFLANVGQSSMEHMGWWDPKIWYGKSYGISHEKVDEFAGKSDGKSYVSMEN